MRDFNEKLKKFKVESIENGVSLKSLEDKEEYYFRDGDIWELKIINGHIEYEPKNYQ